MQIVNRAYFWGLVATTLLLGGCGGGGGGSAPPPTAPTVSITAATSSVLLGQSVSLTWSSTGTTSCTASGAWSGSEAVSGTVSVTPSATGSSTYQLDCSGAGGKQSAMVAVTITPVVPNYSASATTVDPLAPIALTVSNDNPAANYTAKFSLGSNVSFTVPVGISVKGVVTTAAPPGAVTSLAPPAFVAGSITMALGWPDATGTVQYGAPITLQVNALPTIPSTFAPGTAFMTHLIATKRLLVQSTTNLGVIGRKASTLSVINAQVATNKSAQSIDAMMVLVKQIQAGGTVPFGTYNQSPITLNAASLTMLDQLAAAQISAVHTVAGLALAKGSPQIRRQLHVRSQSARAQPAAASLSCVLDDPTCLSTEFAADSRAVASYVGNVASTVCYATAAVAGLAALPELAGAAFVVGVAASFGTTAVGTALSAAIQGGTATLLSGNATAADLLPSVDFFATGVITNVITAFTDLSVETLTNETPSAIIAYNAASAVQTASSAYDNLTSGLSSALTAGTLPTTPVTVPTYTASMTELPTTNSFTVDLTPPPAGSTDLVFTGTDATTAYSTANVTATNGVGSFTDQIYATPQPGDITVGSVTDPTGLVSATVNYDSSFPDASDTSSFPPIGTPTGGTGGGGGAVAPQPSSVAWTIDAVNFGPFDPCAQPPINAANICPAVELNHSLLVTVLGDATGNTLLDLNVIDANTTFSLTGSATTGPAVGAALTSITYTEKFASTTPNGSIAVAGLNTTALVANPPAGYPAVAGLYSYGYLDAHAGATPGTVSFQFYTVPAAGPYVAAGTAAYEYVKGTFTVMVQDDPILASITLGPHQLQGSFNVYMGVCLADFSTPPVTMNCPLN